MPKGACTARHIPLGTYTHYSSVMTASAPPPTRAILLTPAAIFCFGLMDVAVKAVSPMTGTLPALWARYAGQM